MAEFTPTTNPKVDIPALIQWRGDGLTFVELLQYLPYLKGDFTYWVGDKNTIAWIGVSQQCVEALQELVGSDAMGLWPAQPFIYLIDGCALKFPVAKLNRTYKRPHWLPVTFSLLKRTKVAA